MFKKEKKTLQFLWQEKTKSPGKYQHTISTTLQHNEAKIKRFASFNVTRLLFIPNDAFRRSAGQRNPRSLNLENRLLKIAFAHIMHFWLEQNGCPCSESWLQIAFRQNLKNIIA